MEVKRKGVVNMSLKELGVSVRLFPVIGSFWPFAPAQIQSLMSIQFAFLNVSHLLFAQKTRAYVVYPLQTLTIFLFVVMFYITFNVIFIL